MDLNASRQKFINNKIKIIERRHTQESRSFFRNLK
jgi:hypothetical protein